MLALLVCKDPSCRAAFEADGSRRAIGELRCEDCGGPLYASAWADAEPRRIGEDQPRLRRAA
jgi:hypothetical protein